MEDLHILLFPAAISQPVTDDHYLVYLVGEDHARFIEFENLKWYKNGVELPREKIFRWGIVPRLNLDQMNQGGRK